MPLRRLRHILPMLALPVLAACADDPSAAPEASPPSERALAAIVAEPGVDRTELARTIDGVFDEEAVGETRALLVLHGGKVVVERYGPGYGKDTRFIGWSLTKCVTGVVIGLLVSDGRLRRDEVAPVPQWSRPGDPRSEITLRQLLQMRSGLRHSENADPVYQSDTARMLFLEGRGDTARYAEAQPLAARPGSVFDYSTGTSVILSDIATRVLSASDDPARRRKAMAAFLQTRLFTPLGMTSMVPEFDAAGTFIGGSMLHGTARDWGKLGEFLRNGGSVRGAQVIPRRWIEFMRAPSPRNPGYGAHLWLNRPQADGSIHLFPGRAPESLFGCLGHQGQYVIGSPEQRLTVVRLGQTTKDEQAALRRRLGDLVALFPAR